MRGILGRRVQDGVITRLIGKWLKAGVWEKGEVSYPENRTPQGGAICQRPPALPSGLPAAGYLAPLGSPLVSNIYLQEVLDKWFVEAVQPAPPSARIVSVTRDQQDTNGVCVFEHGAGYLAPPLNPQATAGATTRTTQYPGFSRE